MDVGVFVCVHLRKKKMRRGKLSSLVVHGEEREKKVRTKINKITNTHATVTVHICMVTVAIVHKCTIMHKLVVSYSILHNYAQANVIALSCCPPSLCDI